MKNLSFLKLCLTTIILSSLFLANLTNANDKNFTGKIAIGMPNPASVYCEENGGTSQIKTNKDGSQYGICVFSDDKFCEEWALFRGECSASGNNGKVYKNGGISKINEELINKKWQDAYKKIYKESSNKSVLSENLNNIIKKIDSKIEKEKTNSNKSNIYNYLKSLVKKSLDSL